MEPGAQDDDAWAAMDSDCDGFGLGGVAGGIVVEEVAAVLAGHQGLAGGGAGGVVAQVVPALRAEHHLACGAPLVEGLGDGGALGVADAVVGGEGVFAGGALGDLGAQGGALAVELGEGGAVAGEEFIDAGALLLELPGGVGDGLVGEGALGIESFAALHALQLGVFQAVDLGAGEGGLVLAAR